MTAPSTSLFVQNLNDSLVKKDELRRALYAQFSLYGKVLDVVHTRSPKVRGTAFIVFRDLAASTSAMRALDGEGFFGKQLKISYAKSVSHATIGYTEGPEALYLIKSGLKSASDATGKASKLTVSGAQKKLVEDGKRAKRGRGESEEVEEESEEEDEEEGPEKKKKKDEDAMEEESDDEAPEPAAPAPGPAAPAQGTEPNPILFIEGLPAEVSADMLSPLFQQYPGLVSLKLLPTPAGSPPNSGIGFVQYETATQAGTAMDVLDGFLLTKGVALKVSWAKRA